MSITAVIIQARMGSTRFPGKVLADLCGKPILYHVLQACLSIEGKDVVVLAVPDEADSDQLEVVAQNLGVLVVRGSESDVLSRYLKATRTVKADYIMRITCDCPLLDAHVCSQVLVMVKEPGVDYASNVLPRTFEKGLDCEAFTRWALELAASKATEPYDREHVTPFLQRAEHLRRVNVESGKPERAFANWCIDTPDDLERLREMLVGVEAA